MEFATEILDGTPAASGTLLVSVGVVMIKDTLRPRLSDFVIRAPGYAMRVDQFSGTSYFLLDADGQRRSGPKYSTGSSPFGFPGVQRDGRWCFANLLPCGFIWSGKNSLTINGNSTFGHFSRLGYTFHGKRER